MAKSVLLVVVPGTTTAVYYQVLVLLSNKDIHTTSYLSRAGAASQAVKLKLYDSKVSIDCKSRRATVEV